ncbi:acyltransferase domain-containing protein [Cohnella silvisoli]|uniref:Acyltransferase domain-containing protein n=1 Tax=Cohnella silvisoli TaxID=2873699 RepID=A0ABV1KLR4_9BACL|nr:acyltransferase domain-containing protein [Cohnella silvisoli]MCD9020755.1 acyltransferase domain-containing protein [Cohnella silvisoli]
MYTCCGKSMFGDDQIEEANAIVRLPKDAIFEVKETIALMNSSMALSKFADVSHEMVFHSPLLIGEIASFITECGKSLGQRSGLFAVAVLLSGMPQVREYYADRGISDEILLDTFSDLSLWMNVYKEKHGVWGLGEVGWLMNHFRCLLFKIGRLQYVQRSWGLQVHVFRNRLDGRFAVFPEAGISFQPDGEMEGSYGNSDAENTWTSGFERSEQWIKGHLTRADGTVEREVTEWRAEEWEEVLNRESPVLDIHIQEGGKLSTELWRGSMEAADLFYGKTFPDKPFHAFVCSSWLLCPAFGEILPAESNIAKFGGAFRLVPAYTDDNQAFERVFGGKPDRLQDAPRDTLIRQAILDYTINGGRVGNGTGFILPFTR